MPTATRKTNNPHDLFFRFLFSYQDVAVNFIESYLPGEIVEHIDFSHFELDQESYLDEALKQHYSDMVYRTRLSPGTTLRIAILFEHKSSLPSNKYPIQIQLLNYKTGIWRTDRKQGRPPTFVLPVVVYHGSRQWRMQPFWSIFAGLPKSWRPFTDHVPYRLTDLNSLSENEIGRRGKQTYLAAGLLAMKLFTRNTIDQKSWKKLFKFV